jgi:hypothetical protein
MLRKRFCGNTVVRSSPAVPRAARRAMLRGFTLIEELAAFTALAVIAAILFPVFDLGGLENALYRETIDEILLPSLITPPFDSAAGALEAKPDPGNDPSLMVAKMLSKEALEKVAEKGEMIATGLDMDEDGSISEDEYRVVCDVESLEEFCPPEGEPSVGSVSVEEAKMRTMKPFAKKHLFKYLDEEEGIAKGEREALKSQFRGEGNDKTEFANYHNLVEKLFASKSSKLSLEMRLKLHIAAWLVEL